MSALVIAASGYDNDGLAVPRANFATADADASGGLDAAEFKSFVDANAQAQFGKAAKIQKRGAYARAFSKVDADKNESVSWSEFAAQQ